MIEELVIPETWFFRERLAFRRLSRYLDECRSSRRGSVRVLSVACSTGEEVYSLAITLREAGSTASNSRILGTDVSRKALAVAREGSYSSRSFREPDETIRALRERWCRAVGDSWRVCDDLRGGVEFANENLARHDFLVGESPFHVVFCRNVLIYFHSEARPRGSSAPAPALDAGRCPVFRFGRSAVSSVMLVFRPWAATARSLFAVRRSSSDDRLNETVRPAAIPLLPAPALPVRARPAVGAKQRRATSTGQPTVAAAAAPEVESAPALLAAARQAADNGRLEEASVLCDRVLAQDAASAEAHYLRGLVRQARSNWSEAQRCFEKALYLQPKHYEALVHLMLLAERQGDQNAAANYRRRAQQVAPGEVP